jgi:protein tyrosine/serine phosphatase
VRRFFEFSPNRFRSGKYTASELADAVSRFGIRRVVDLRDRPERIMSPRTYTRIGVEYIRLPLSDHEPIPASVLDVVDRDRTLVHCWNGSHKTGAVVAMIRMRDGWAPEEVWSEMQAFGFGRWDAHHALAASVFGDWRPPC